MMEVKFTLSVLRRKKKLMTPALTLGRYTSEQSFYFDVWCNEILIELNSLKFPLFFKPYYDRKRYRMQPSLWKCISISI